MKGTRTKGTITLVAQLNKVVHRRTTEELLGMRWKHFVALATLAGGAATQQQALCEAMLMDPNNCVLLLNELEALGFIERVRDPVDRRRHLVAMTELGAEAYDRAQIARESVEDDVLKALDADERVQLRALLLKAIDG